MRKTIALAVGIGVCAGQVWAAPSAGTLASLDARLEKDRDASSSLVNDRPHEQQ
jgi:hypothetical protein